MLNKSDQPFPFEFLSHEGVIEIRPAANESPDLFELFYFLALLGASQQRAVLCHTFWPEIDLELDHIWTVEEGPDVLARLWSVIQKTLEKQSAYPKPWLHVRRKVGHGFIELHRKDSVIDAPGKVQFRYIR